MENIAIKRNFAAVIIVFLVLTAAIIWYFNKPKLAQRAKYVAILTASDLQLSGIDGIKAGLEELGYEEGKEIVIKVNNPKGDLNLMNQMAADIVTSKPDLIVSLSTSAASAIKNADKDARIPVVAADVGNFAPLGVENIQHPGEFITGVIVDNVVAAPKRMEILKTMLPGLKTVGILANPQNVSYKNVVKVHNDGASKLGIKLLWYNVTKKEEVSAAVKKMISDKVGAFITINDAVVSGNSTLIAPPLKQAKIPSMDFNVERGVSSGYLMVYGVPRFDVGRQSARIIDKILKGGNPGDIPIEFASNITFEINSALAKEMGISIPESLILQANKVYNQ